MSEFMFPSYWDAFLIQLPANSYSLKPRPPEELSSPTPWLADYNTLEREGHTECQFQTEGKLIQLTQCKQASQVVQQGQQRYDVATAGNRLILAVGWRTLDGIPTPLQSSLQHRHVQQFTTHGKPWVGIALDPLREDTALEWAGLFQPPKLMTSSTVPLATQIEKDETYLQSGLDAIVTTALFTLGYRVVGFPNPLTPQGMQVTPASMPMEGWSWIIVAVIGALLLLFGPLCYWWCHRSRTQRGNSPKRVHF
jgi:hypothetical protein